MFSETTEELLLFLEHSKERSCSVVVMPDFFLDRFISYEGDVKDFHKSVSDIAGRKGGSINGIGQMDFRGGNAANTAAALAVLGAKVYPIIHTSSLGLTLLNHYLQPYNVDLSYVKADGETSITTAIELTHRKEKVNVMLRDLGSLAKFSSSDFTLRDYQLLEKADYVCVFNWAGTRRYGTELAQTIFSHVKKKGKGKTYYDTADPTPNKGKISTLMKTVLSTNIVDILSVNENEAIQYASQLDHKKIEELQKNMRLDELAKECARILAQNLSARIDLHATTYAGTFTKSKETIVPALKVPVKRITGAGDAWNAANLYADANKFSDSHRLGFANAIAAYYISNRRPEHPTSAQLKMFIQNYQN
ncbi:MAG: carbohydrate kinase family protein [Candidatus Bathyarchaeota archaeon]|nr:carbohydrate kinase family protein [Candidatus Bathyarchaeota archaeon]MDH5732369.1 carbohydrate kinase family protein [Candidatus Bathyarchaeota archaeon]